VLPSENLLVIGCAFFTLLNSTAVLKVRLRKTDASLWQIPAFCNTVQPFATLPAEGLKHRFVRHQSSIAGCAARRICASCNSIQELRKCSSWKKLVSFNKHARFVLASSLAIEELDDTVDDNMDVVGQRLNGKLKDKDNKPDRVASDMETEDAPI
jgi:hypothetical protein